MYWLLGIILFVVLWAFVLRPFVRDLPIFDPLFDWLEPIERKLWAKSRTILAARLAWVPAALLSIHDTIAAWALDWTPILSRLVKQIPEDMQGLAMAAVIGVIGLVFERLRRITSEPLSDKE